MQHNVTAFALDNDGFRYALATAQGAELVEFAEEAEKSWKVSSEAVLEIIRRIKDMEAFTTVSILSLNESYRAVQKMCTVLSDIRSNITRQKKQADDHLIRLKANKTFEDDVKNQICIEYTKEDTVQLDYPMVIVL